jgi:hypothetical protein
VSTYGAAIPKLFGTMRVAGSVIWSTDLIERRATTGGGKGRPRQVDYSYSASFAVALSGRPILSVKRIWADGKLLRGAAGDFKAATQFRVHTGDDDQAADPLIVAAEGVGQAPAFRGIAYAMFEDFALADYGNRIPSLTFEVEADAGPVTIAEVADALSEGAIAAGAAPALAGFAATGASLRSAVEALADFAGLSLTDDNGGLILGRAQGPAALVGEETARREVARRAAASVPAEVSLAYHDVARDYQAGLQRARAEGAPGEGRIERQAAPAALSAEAAKALAEQRLAALWAERTQARVGLGWSWAALRPGTLVALEGEAGQWRIARKVIGPMSVRLELARVAGTPAPTAPAAPGRAVSEPDLPHGPTIVRLLDLPLGDAADQPFVAVVAAGVEPGWRRAELSLSLDQGASWADVGATAAPAVMGHAATALAGGDAALIDAAAAVEVELLHAEMELLSRDDEALVAGANLALIGAELVQFGHAERIGEARWRLTRLLRGRRGTEHGCSGHVAGEAFVLLELAAMLRSEPAARIEAGAPLLLLASGVGDAIPATASLAVTAEAMRPPSPVHVAAAEQADGSLLLRWVRRSRSGWNWPSGGDTPLGEESEVYQLTLSGAGFSRSVQVAESQWLYSAAERAADGAGVTIEIAQAGTHAASRPATIFV